MCSSSSVTFAYKSSYTLNCNVFFFKQKTAYEMRISDWSSDVCSSDLDMDETRHAGGAGRIDDMRGRGRVACLEIGAGRDVDDAGDVEQRVAARGHLDQAVGSVEGAGDPGRALGRLLRPAGQGAGIGRASGWARVCQYWSISVVAV